MTRVADFGQFSISVNRLLTTPEHDGLGLSMAGWRVDNARWTRWAVLRSGPSCLVNAAVTGQVPIGPVTWFPSIFTSRWATVRRWSAIGGGLLWGILAGIAVTARVLQWRILKRNPQLS
jgi:hypothetical protein